MAQIEYNKTFLMRINKEMQIRENALPVLKNKEAALRAETRRIRAQLKEAGQKISEKMDLLKPMQRMWSEFPQIVRIKTVHFKRKKLASINVDSVDKVEFEIKEFELSAHPSWFLQGIETVKEVLTLKVEQINMEKILESVEYARRKTTQKVNLYEKVQIPFFRESVRKIKRFLEDEENLSKSSQKVIKKRMEEVVAV